MTARDRRLESGLAWFTLGALAVYVPAETWTSWPHLTGPGYVVDALAMVLLGVSAVYSLRVQPAGAIAPLTAAWGWTACLWWRAYFTRRISRERGLGIYTDERWHETVIGYAMIVGLCAFAFSLYLAFRATTHPAQGA